MTSATINDPIPQPEGITEIHEQRKAALAEFIQARDVNYRQEQAKLQSYANLVQFLKKNRKDFSAPAIEFLDAWAEEHAKIESAQVSSQAALRASQNAIYTSQNAAADIFGKYANRIDEVRKKASEPNQDHVFENSKLASLLTVLTQFTDKKRKRKASK
ncbi:hypothetical protein ATU3B_00275 [Agrobacterium genomosp. 3 str. CIP 111-78]|uniref:Uncharacterized protein n=1 Tax=Agrobacterium tumefaciens TaxID=358 RepID=A0AAE6EN88_AGRTU|nr:MULTISPECIES: hypothetical protein [Agrobacterium tumefaciens complex]MCA2370040.1 hypothetical protein [Agrobacterium tomkonis CIP 111-78]QCM03466.1 hypothetical protein CFBP6624_24890 [Agrobacterium tumefaciens]